MEAAQIHHLETILILLLVVVIGFAILAKRVGTPYPVVLVIAGLLLSFVPGIPRFSLNPDVVLLAILPPLLFAGAFLTSWREFRANIVSIGFLAFGLVTFTVFGVAWSVHWILPGFDWRLGLVLGAVISTTDAIAATAIARRLGLPNRIVDILEGESMINDASGLLALEFTVALMVTGRHPGFTEIVGQLLYLVIGGIAIGLVLAKVVQWIETRLDDAPIEIAVSLITPYIAYLTAERFGCSGAFATVACGLYFGRQSAKFFSSTARIEARAVWNTLTFILNGIVFVLIGLQLPFVLADIRALSLQQLLVRGALFSALVILLRLMWEFPGAHLAGLIRRTIMKQALPVPSPRELFVIGWTGMRGVVALAAAVSLPEFIPQRNIIIFLTFCVIFVTLVLQGLTLPWVIRQLGIATPAGRNCEEEEARRIVLEAATEKINELRENAEPASRELLDDLARHYERRLTAAKDQEGQSSSARLRHIGALAKQVLDVERTTAINLRDQNRINDEVLRTLQREQDLLDARFKVGTQ
jgi:monovalent cation/hydrogen antiporter